MDTILGILGFALMVGLVWGIRSLVNKGTTAVSDAVTGNSRTRSQDAVTTKLFFDAPVPVAHLTARIQETLTESGTGLRFKSAGGALAIEKPGLGAPNMTYLLVGVDEDDGVRCKGFASAQSWRESDGRVDSVKSIESIQQHIRQAVLHFGGTFNESAGTTPA